MTSPGGNGSASSSALKRYGPLIGIVVVLAVIAGVVVLSSGGSDDGGQTATSGTNESSSTSTGGSEAGEAPVLTYQAAEAAGTAASTTWVDNCDPETGRIEVPSVYAAPCVPAFEGDNGGATSKGVTADTIKIVNYTPPPNADITGALQGAADEPEKVIQTGKDFVVMLQDLMETYGRTVVVEEFQGTGAGDDAVAAQADATDIVEMEPFAVLGGPAQTRVYAEEMARAQIICIGCGLALPDSFTQEHAPYIWGVQPSAEEFLTNFSGYVQNSLLGRKATFAGDEAMHDKERVFGVVHFEQDPPVFNELTERLAECGATRGYEAAVTETYEFEIGKLPERATTVIAKMKAAGVTTVLFLGDPLMPIYLTQQATAQDYHPEWVIAGTVFTDTTALGRLYDQDQWAHAFGVSNLAARTPREISGSYQLHEWYYGKPPVAEKTSGVILPPLNQLFLGIHLAGPNLTPATYRDGLFAMPAAGGGPTTPTISYGPDAGFKMIGENCELDAPRPDYFAIDDTVEIWWDADATGVDEQGKEGKGMYVYANEGKRYGPGQMPAADSNAFKDENTVMIFEQVPPEDRAPDYPSPAASSAGA
jgi:hypothetical protein